LLRVSYGCIGTQEIHALLFRRKKLVTTDTKPFEEMNPIAKQIKEQALVVTDDYFKLLKKAISSNPSKGTEVRAWSTTDVRTLKTLARKKTKAGKIEKRLKRTEGATRQKAFSIGFSLDARA